MALSQLRTQNGVQWRSLGWMSSNSYIGLGRVFLEVRHASGNVLAQAFPFPIQLYCTDLRHGGAIGHVSRDSPVLEGKTVASSRRVLWAWVLECTCEHTETLRVRIYRPEPAARMHSLPLILLSFGSTAQQTLHIRQVLYTEMHLEPRESIKG